MNVEAATVEAFIAANRRQRWLDALPDAKRRTKILVRLADGGDIDDRYPQLYVPSGKREEQVRDLHEALIRRGAPGMCHVIARDIDIDGLDMPLLAALEACSDDGSALLICIPGRLALHLPESPSHPVILQRGASG